MKSVTAHFHRKFLNDLSMSEMDRPDSEEKASGVSFRTKSQFRL